MNWFWINCREHMIELLSCKKLLLSCRQKDWKIRHFNWMKSILSWRIRLHSCRTLLMSFVKKVTPLHDDNVRLIDEQHDLNKYYGLLLLKMVERWDCSNFAWLLMGSWARGELTTKWREGVYYWKNWWHVLEYFFCWCFWCCIYWYNL